MKNLRIVSGAVLAAGMALVAARASALQGPMGDPAPVVAKCDTELVGTVRVCTTGKGWSVTAVREDSGTAGIEYVRMVFTPNFTTGTVAFVIRLDVPQLDMQHEWQTRLERYRLALGAGMQHSNFTDGVPVRTVFNSVNRNRLTYALDDPIRDYSLGGGTWSGDMDNPMINARAEFKLHAKDGEKRLVLRLDRRDVFWSDALGDAVEWIRKGTGPKMDVPDSAYMPLYSTWYAFCSSPRLTAEKVERNAALAARLGMGTIILDDGWQTSYGSWPVNEKRFPDRRAHVAKVKAAGLKYMLWFALPYMGWNNEAATRFKGWELFIGRERTPLFKPYASNQREYLIGVFERALREWDVDGFKIDFIDKWREFPKDTQTFMDELVRRLKAIKPDILIEFREPYTGPAILRYGNMVRALDCPGDAQANHYRIANLRVATGGTAVHSDMIEWNPRLSAELAAQTVLSVIFSTVQYSVDLTVYPEDHLRMIGHWCGFARRHVGALQKGRFRAYYPQNGYPMLEGEDADERVIAVYLPGMTADVAADSKQTTVINGTAVGRLTVRSAAAAVVEVYDTFGTRVRTQKVGRGLSEIDVPVSGYLVVRRK